jgi:hypothetical protein
MTPIERAQEMLAAEVMLARSYADGHRGGLLYDEEAVRVIAGLLALQDVLVEALGAVVEHMGTKDDESAFRVATIALARGGRLPTIHEVVQ